MAAKQITTTTQTTMQTPTTTKTIAEGTTTTQKITEGETTTKTTTKQCSSCTPPDPQSAPPIIDTILADVNAIIPNFSSLVSSYRLLVGAAEEIHRIPGVCPDVFERAVRRFDNAGTLIDILLDLLCCKIAYSSEFLGMICAPIDLFRLFINRFEPCDESHFTADQIIALEALRKSLTDCLKSPCFSDHPVVCPNPAAAPPSTPPSWLISQLKTVHAAQKENRQQHDNKTKPPNQDFHTATAPSKNNDAAPANSPLKRRHI